MPALDEVFQLDPESLVQELPVYQQDIVRSILTEKSDPDNVLMMWLSAFPPGTEPFGGEQEDPQLRALYVEKFMDELEAFLCGGPQYEAQRAQLTSQKTHVSFVAAVSWALVATLGTSAIAIAPMVVLVLVCAGKMSIKTWCAVRQELHKEPPTS